MRFLKKSIEALSLSDYNHLREILGLSPVVMGNNEFLVHCDTWNYMDGIRQGLKQQPEIHTLMVDLDYCRDTDSDGADGAVSNGRNEGICTCSAG